MTKAISDMGSFTPQKFKMDTPVNVKCAKCSVKETWEYLTLFDS